MKLGEFISTIFLRSKKDGSYRTILNLKQFNEFVQYRHFKMDTLDTVIRMMKPGCYMASIDLKDAYYLLQSMQITRSSLSLYLKGLYINTHAYLMAYPVHLEYSQKYLNQCMLPYGVWVT